MGGWKSSPSALTLSKSRNKRSRGFSSKARFLILPRTGGKGEHIIITEILWLYYHDKIMYKNHITYPCCPWP